MYIHHMGLDAQVIAIGPFSNEIASSLEYGESFYASVATGATVVSNVFIAGTSAASHALATAFGVGAMELGRHRLDPSAANRALLTAEFGERDVENFECLAARGFEFFYLPNA